jgi:hypothetical protein
MNTALGIGGFFFRSENLEELAQWYSNHLGVAEVPANYETLSWALSKQIALRCARAVLSVGG